MSLPAHARVVTFNELEVGDCGAALLVIDCYLIMHVMPVKPGRPFMVCVQIWEYAVEFIMGVYLICQATIVMFIAILVSMLLMFALHAVLLSHAATCICCCLSGLRVPVAVWLGSHDMLSMDGNP